MGSDERGVSVREAYEVVYRAHSETDAVVVATCASEAEAGEVASALRSVLEVKYRIGHKHGREEAATKANREQFAATAPSE